MGKFTVIIPARYSSSRLPAKPLLNLAGKPMVVRVVEQALKTNANRVIVATDASEIFDVVRQYGYEVCITSTQHSSGTERLAEVVEIYKISNDEIIVNVQGDEPLIPPAIIEQVATNLYNNPQINIATLATKLASSQEIFNPNIVKIVRDINDFALYFSRSPMPFDRENFSDTNTNQTSSNINLACYLRHVGIYGYRAKFIKQYIKLEPSILEQIEKLEQLRILWHGYKIHVDLAQERSPIGVDTWDDYLEVAKHFNNILD